MKTFKFTRAPHSWKYCVFITLDENIHDIHSKRVNILYVYPCKPQFYYVKVVFKGVKII